MSFAFALQLFDLVGIFVFALSGGVLAVRHRLDLFGVLVLACATAVTGGMVRDVLIGAIPPASLADWRYLATAMFAGLVTFRWHRIIERLRNPVLSSVGRLDREALKRSSALRRACPSARPRSPPETAAGRASTSRARSAA